MYSSTSQKITLFFTSFPTVCLHKFLCVEKILKESTIFLITSLPTLLNWSGKDPGTNKSSNRRLMGKGVGNKLQKAGLT